LQDKAIGEGIISAPKVWRLSWFLRNSKNKAEMDKIFDGYSKALIQSFFNKKPTNTQRFPIAARWAEFLTKK
jgi:hypothetical protein